MEGDLKYSKGIHVIYGIILIIYFITLTWLMFRIVETSFQTSALSLWMLIPLMFLSLLLVSKVCILLIEDISIIFELEKNV